MKKSRLFLSITYFVLIFLYLPVLLLIAHSFNASRFGGAWSGFTFHWYQKLFTDGNIWGAFMNTLIIGVSSTLASTVLGTMAAYALYRFRSPLQKAHFAILYTPLIIPDILAGISLLLFFVAMNIHLGLTTIFIAHTTFCISYVTMVMLTKFQNFDFTIVEAAQDLGADTRAILRRVLLPMMTPGIIAAALLAFTLSIDDFVITYFVAGEGAATLPLYIYSMIKFGSTPVINALCTLILLATFILVWLFQSYAEEEA